jgi:hypothetical protein
MTGHEFQNAWKEVEGKLRPISFETLNKFRLSSLALEFLNLSGLPDEAAPFLTFVGDTNTSNKYDCIDLLTNWFDFLPPEFSKYVVIGSDGCGDIIALNVEEDCIVEWLDHEDGFSSRFMNSTIQHLASSLVTYSMFVKAIKKENGEDAYANSNFSDTQYETLYDFLKSIDRRTVTEGFWELELSSLISIRNET